MKDYKLVVIEGVDSSGKETQTNRLFDVFISVIHHPLPNHS